MVSVSLCDPCDLRKLTSNRTRYQGVMLFVTTTSAMASSRQEFSSGGFKEGTSYSISLVVTLGITYIMHNYPGLNTCSQTLQWSRNGQSRDAYLTISNLHLRNLNAFKSHSCNNDFGEAI